MMRTTQIFFLLGLLLPLGTVVTSLAIKHPEDAGQKPGVCPPERFYIKASNPDIIHNICKDNDYKCEDNLKCCNDNGHKMCKPPYQDKPGQCPTYTAAYATRCNDNCTCDSECSGNKKCCYKSCGRTCVDIGEPNTEHTARKGFCQQEKKYKCGIDERQSCDESSCMDGYKCCPRICRIQCEKALPERDGSCPANPGCPSGVENKSCSSDYDCSTFHKCCSTSCGQRCLLAENIHFNLHDIHKS